MRPADSAEPSASSNGIVNLSGRTCVFNRTAKTENHPPQNKACRCCVRAGSQPALTADSPAAEACDGSDSSRFRFKMTAYKRSLYAQKQIQSRRIPGIHSCGVPGVDLGLGERLKNLRPVLFAPLLPAFSPDAALGGMP